MKKIRLTQHARQRLNERLPFAISKVTKLFQDSIYCEDKGTAEIHKNGNIVFVVKQNLGSTYHLITVYKESESDPSQKI